MRSLRSGLLGSLLCVLAMPATALALPGDPPITPISPPDGGSVAPSRDGFQVVYTCPDYRTQDVGTFALHGALTDYGATLATSPELGSDGRLHQDNRIDLDQAHQSNTLPEGQCLSTLGNERAGLGPGTYFWQATRICTGCPGSYETSAVQTVVVKASIAAAVRVAGSVYARYPAAFSIPADGAPDGTRVALERRTGSTWQTVGTTSARANGAEVIATLPAGKQELRATLTIGDQTAVSPSTSVAVRKPGGRRATSARSDGAWAGTDRKPVRFAVAANGREIRDFHADITMVCPQVTAPGSVGSQVTTMAGAAQFGRAKVAPDGRFYGVVPGADTSVLVRGRLSGRTLSGGVAQLSVGTCTGSLRFGARHR